jgi:hypothetical protein
MVPYLILLVGFGLLGTCVTQLLTYRFLPLSEILRWHNWDSLSIAGAVAGTLLGHLLWVLAKPSERVSRATVISVSANILAWISFLIFSPPLPTSEFERIAAERAQRDAISGGMDLTTDQPIVVAGRWYGTFGTMNFADGLLSVFAAPAIGFADLFQVLVDRLEIVHQIVPHGVVHRAVRVLEHTAINTIAPFSVSITPDSRAVDSLSPPGTSTTEIC